MPGNNMGGGENGGLRTLVSRRGFLYGALGVGAAAAVGVGAVALNSAADNSNEISALNAPRSSLSTLSDFQALETPDDHIRKVVEHDLPYGSLIWANDDEIAACLLPTEVGTPLAQVGLLYLGSGQVTTVLEQAKGASDGYEIYDARATSSGLIWTEANILQGTWRIYAAPLTNEQLGEALMLEEGADEYDTPTLAVAGKRAFWQVLPKATGASGRTSRLMGATFGKNDASVVYESSRRMGTPPYGSTDSVTIAPRIDSSSLYYELTNIDAVSGSVRDTLILPHSIAPIEAGYGETGFMFSLPDIYSFEGAISNLGTYTPRSKPNGGDYNAAKWFDFARTPTAAPAWCDDLLIVKSTYSVCGIDLKAGTYFTIEVENGADSYGEYLASTGSRDTFVTFTNIDHTPVNSPRVHTCRVKVWTRI